jgi:hypothetical protein
MDTKEFEVAVNAAGGKIGLLNKGAYNALQGMIEGGERIIAAAECIDTKGAGAVIVTDRHFYGAKMTGMFSFDKTAITLAGIGSASLSGGFSKILTVTDGTRIYTFSQISKPDAVMAAIQAGKSAPAAQPGPAAALAVSPDLTAELRKFKALLDDGIITQEDFDKKKALLLGI